MISISFEKIVEIAGVNRDLSMNPLFQVMLAMSYSSNENHFELSNCDISQQQMDISMSKFDLTITIVEGDSTLGLNVEYATALFKQNTIRHFCDCFQELLDQIILAPHNSIKRLDVLAEKDKLLLQQEYNLSSIQFDSPENLLDLIEKSCNEFPHKLALVDTDHHVTYQELWMKSEKIGAALIKEGVTQGDLVAVGMGRSVNMIIAMVGVLRVGAAYVPLDMHHPEERVNFIIKDTGCQLIITEKKLIQLLPSEYIQKAFLVEDILKSNYSSIPRSLTKPDQLAYVLYTSGSTGNPKGVMIEHRNVVALIHSYRIKTGHEKWGSGISLCPFVFDVSVWEIFTNLCFGGTLHILNKDSIDPKAIVNYLSDKQIENAYLPPTILKEIIEEIEAFGGGLSLKSLLVGVMSIQQELLQKIKKLIPGIVIINGYGPTETTICATFYRFEQIIPGLIHTPIGRATHNNKIYLLDEFERMVPFGAVGEICVVGAGVGRGYLGGHDSDSTRFTTSPFDDNLRMYKTGDLAKWLPEGELQYLGRNDDQVKIGGYRIELNEIESKLKECALLIQCTVLVIGNDSNKKLFGFGVPSSEEVDESSIIAYLKQLLPSYMVPLRWCLLKKMPITNNGKVNKEMLLEMAAGYSLHRQNEKVALTPIQHEMLEIWKDILDLEILNIHDNFFEVGGNSLLAIRLVHNIRKHFQIDISVKTLFKAKDIKALCEQVEIIVGENISESKSNYHIIEI
ncbi:non-ribosomal peptide synthetase [Fulvivirga maritima]|uniref:non-ribosomal peptide synthetase n=1 Tax=Fulvivirga maritima TaxID=2904247 RepID=UPI002796029D|nr:amino acid adenylation domain-containing protein [Fulvivirga maritima]